METFLYTTKVASEIAGINKWYEEIQEHFGKIKFHTSLMDKKKLQPDQRSKWKKEKETLYLLEKNIVKFLFSLSIGESYQTDSRSKNIKDW